MSTSTGWLCLSLFLSIPPIAATSNPSATPSVIGILFIPAAICIFGSIAAWISHRNLPNNVGSVTKFGDSRWFRVFRAATGVGLSPCGCLYENDGYSPAGPPDTETIETVEFWKRSAEGAKIHFRLMSEKLVRCSHCGGYYHKESRSREQRKEHIEFWRDDTEPYPNDDREIREETA